MNKKIKSREELREIVSRLREEGKSAVTCNGSFDLMHIGHIKFLQEAKEQGDVLIVGLNSDSSVKEYKGADRPINSQEHRAEFLAAMECVDYVTVFDETDPREFLKAVGPDVHVNGAEYGMDCIERGVVLEGGGTIHLVPLYKNFSTTMLIQKILEVYGGKG
ncbi:MAG: adenylyltransferase/cytidyltransferase family protein [Candidatus Altiarchaeota archaeon]|nr:adenylyltransferase/cytidyltransferase family protein [Candidatus Altiarchaeota archaeon]